MGRQAYLTRLALVGEIFAHSGCWISQRSVEVIFSAILSNLAWGPSFPPTGALRIVLWRWHPRQTGPFSIWSAWTWWKWKLQYRPPRQWLCLRQLCSAIWPARTSTKPKVQRYRSRVRACEKSSCCAKRGASWWSTVEVDRPWIPSRARASFPQCGTHIRINVVGSCVTKAASGGRYCLKLRSGHLADSTKLDLSFIRKCSTPSGPQIRDGHIWLSEFFLCWHAHVLSLLHHRYTENHSTWWARCSHSG